MSVDEPDAALFLALEISLHRPEVRSSPRSVSDLLADEFIEFGSSGRVYNKTITIRALAEEAISESTPPPQVSDFSVRRLSDDVVLVTYKSIRASTEPGGNRQTLRSSIYKLFDGRWQMIFRQGTIIPQA
ncbi:DUF4440 domain-containing protein [Rhizobium leguminosarum]|uniref:nuclear transport factor 2 family protein n=1 Tax=Rhizobium leguminosarum TaxID=384 RepID=UPI001C942190|nr:DUF4440 domain-containing protein [Rhizobium leguminosarum]MBY5363661.1 DUF4440 domain-containing protein [Rhizobium leguminosarum]